MVDAEGVDVTIALRVPTLDEEGMCARNVAFPSNNALRRLDWPVGFSEGDIVAFDEMNETAN